MYYQWLAIHDETVVVFSKNGSWENEKCRNYLPTEIISTIYSNTAMRSDYEQVVILQNR